MKLAHQTWRIGQGNEHAGKSHGRERTVRGWQAAMSRASSHIPNPLLNQLEHRLGQERNHVARLTQGSEKLGSRRAACRARRSVRGQAAYNVAKGCRQNQPNRFFRSSAGAAQKIVRERKPIKDNQAGGQNEE